MILKETKGVYIDIWRSARSYSDQQCEATTLTSTAQADATHAIAHLLSQEATCGLGDVNDLLGNYFFTCG